MTKLLSCMSSCIWSPLRSSITSWLVLSSSSTQDRMASSFIRLSGGRFVLFMDNFTNRLFYLRNIFLRDYFTNGLFYKWTILQMDYYKWTILQMDYLTWELFYKWIFFTYGLFYGRYFTKLNCLTDRLFYEWITLLVDYFPNALLY